MRIVVVNTAASSGGALSILKDFASYIKENEKQHEWIFVLSDHYIAEADNIKTIILKDSKSKLKRVMYDLYKGKKIISELNADIIFSLQNTPIYGVDVPQVVYLHQSIPFQKIKKYSFFNSEERGFAFIQHLLGKYIKFGLKIADKVIVQTEWMDRSLSNYISPSKVEVVAPSINLPSLEKEFNYNYNKFIYPTSTAPYKNIDLILEACKYINENHPELEYTVYLTTEDNYDIPNVESIGQISREKVLDFMSKNVLLFPSYIETFGLPLAEGRLMNSLIFASDVDFSNEVLNQYTNGYFFNPFNAIELAQLMLKSINGELTRKQSNEVLNNKNSWEEVSQIILGAKKAE